LACQPYCGVHAGKIALCGSLLLLAELFGGLHVHTRPSFIASVPTGVQQAVWCKTTSAVNLSPIIHRVGIFPYMIVKIMESFSVVNFLVGYSIKKECR